MNASFRGAVAQVQLQTRTTLTHQQKVTRMYRKALLTLNSWAIDRETFNKEGLAIRARFDAHKHHAPSSGIVARLMREGEEELAKFTHPDPYVVPYMPGGSKFMRNPPPPLKAVFPEGIPSEHDVAYQDVHSVQVPQSAYPEGMETVFIDIYKKKSE